MSALATAPAVDRDQLVRHLDTLRAGLPDPDGLLTPVWSKPGGSRYVRHAGAAEKYAADALAARTNFYVGVGLVTTATADRIGHKGRTKAADIAGLPGLWLDPG